MAARPLPEGVTIEVVDNGHVITHRGTRSWGTSSNVRIDRLFRVFLDGQIIGHVKFVMITRERRTPGRRYVDARWESPGWKYQEGNEPLDSIYSMGTSSYWSEASSRGAAIESLVWGWRRKARS